MENEKLREILAQEYRAHYLKVGAMAELGAGSDLELIALAAMRRAYKAGWDDQCDVVAGCLV